MADPLKELAGLFGDVTPDMVVIRRWGLVTSLSPFTVNVEGTLIPNMKRAASYTPTNGDQVAIDCVGTDWTVAYKAV